MPQVGYVICLAVHGPRPCRVPTASVSCNLRRVWRGRQMGRFCRNRRRRRPRWGTEQLLHWTGGHDPLWPDNRHDVLVTSLCKHHGSKTPIYKTRLARTGLVDR